MGEVEPMIEIDVDAFRRLIERSEPVLPREDQEELKQIADKIEQLNRMVRTRGTTIARLRRLFHLMSSEKTKDVLGGESGGSAEETAQDSLQEAMAQATGEKDGDGSKPEEKKKGHGKNPSSAHRNAKRVPVPHPSLRPGDPCPACCRSQVHSMKNPARILRFEGQPAIAGTIFELGQLRCSGCGQVFTAAAPEEAKGDKYAESAAAMIALLHYGAGMPFHRLARLQANLQSPLPASTQWDIVLDRSERIRPAYEQLILIAAQGKLIHADDTHARITDFMGRRRAKLLLEGELPDPDRTGLFTSGILSVTEDERSIALFFTGRKYAGENLAQLLKARAKELEAPVLMSDALGRNVPVGQEVVESNCLGHGRRNLVDEAANFPEECRFLLEELGKVFKNDAITRKEKMNDEDRLRFHQRQSGPVLGRLRKWIRAQLREKRIEPNSGMGDALRYLLKHWRKLTLFLRRAGVPLTNNIVERAIKMVIGYRKNSYFFRSETGARVGDMYMSLIYTAQLAGENPFDYLTVLMKHASEVAEHPADWMPWNYRVTMTRGDPGSEIDRVA
jgi:transposase